MLGIGKNFREVVWKNLDQRQTKIQGTPGLLGDGSGNVAVPGLQNYVYIRIAGGVIQVFNNRVPLVNDLPVVVGYDPLVPGRLQVLSTQADLGIMSQVITPSSGFAQSSRYRWMDPNGGEDPLFVEQRQIMPLRLYPAGGLSVAVYPAVVKTPRGYYLVGGNTTYDLASLLPSSEGVRFVVFYLDDQGQIQYQAGSTVAWNDFDLSKLPQLGGNAVHLIGAVRLYYGQTEIREGRVNTDILDLRLCRKSVVLKDEQSALEALSVEEGTLAYAIDTARFGVYIGTQWRWMGIVDWADIQNKPSTFPPSAHMHLLSEITGHDKAAHDVLDIDADTLDGQHASAFAQASHIHTPSDVGLGNVTNDAQLKRAGNDFTEFTEKTVPADNDLILSEDSAASYAKKKITLGNIYLWFKGRYDNLYAALSHNHNDLYYTETELNTSGAGGAVHWNNVTNKPSTYPPSTHQHAANDVTSGVFDVARIPNLDASKITSGTLSTDRFSAYSDLSAESKLGLVKDKVLRGQDVRFLHSFDVPTTYLDFDTSSLPTGYSWEGSPFISPPTTQYMGGTAIRLIGYTSAFRSFLYRTYPSGSSIFFALVNMDTNTTGTYIGIRLDDGTDNNYAEFVIYYYNSTTEPNWRFYLRQRTGGGTIVETEAVNLRSPLLPTFTWLRYQCLGTLWSNWLPITMSVNTSGLFRAVNGSYVSWTPQRVGIVFGSPSPQSWNSFACDVFGHY